MSDIHLFKIPNAEITPLYGNGIRVTLNYPKNPELTEERFPADPKRGIQILTDYKEKKRAKLADAEHPIRPASGGVIDVLRDGRLVVTRRDNGAPAYKLHHDTALGYPSNEDETLRPDIVAYRKGAEEHLFFTREKPHKLLIPRHEMVKRATIQAADKLGIDTSKSGIVPVNVWYRPGPDILDICAEDGRRIKFHYGFISLGFEQETGLDFLLTREWEWDPENMLPLDAEGEEKSSEFNYFNREVFVLSPEDLKNKKEGDRLENAKVYRGAIAPEGGFIPERQAEEPFGTPYLFKPTPSLRRMLYGLGIWKGDWIEAEIDKLNASTKE